VSQAAPAVGNDAASVKQDVGLLDRHHFLLRRLHSLTGIMPVGVFVIFHLFTNAQMVFGTFDHEVQWIHSLPALLFLEVFGLWLPIAFHSALGIVYIFSGQRNTSAYPYGGNWRYALQRWTAWTSLIFIVYHVATLRWGWSFFGLVDTPFIFPDQDLGGAMANAGLSVTELGHASTAIALQYSPLILLLYIVGTYSVIYHWSNGLWTSAITWGLTLSVASQKRWGYVCGIMGVSLSVFAAMALWGAMTFEVTPAHRAAIVAFQEHQRTQELPTVTSLPDGGFELRSAGMTQIVHPDGRIERIEHD
jgi:succinate dehydrogenase / fumarate reductase cytochrome b subunit